MVSRPPVSMRVWRSGAGQLAPRGTPALVRAGTPRRHGLRDSLNLENGRLPESLLRRSGAHHLVLRPLPLVHHRRREPAGSWQRPPPPSERPRPPAFVSPAEAGTAVCDLVEHHIIPTGIETPELCRDSGGSGPGRPNDPRWPEPRPARSPRRKPELVALRSMI